MTDSRTDEHSETLIYESRIFKVYEGDVHLPNGKVFRHSRIDHRPCVTVVPIDPEGKIVLIRQFRPAINDYLIEIPAGNMDKGSETVEVCVQRELAEETGFQARELIKIFEGYLLPGYCNEYMHFYLARDLFPAPLPPDEDEFIEVLHCTFAEAQRMIQAREIIDAKTALGIFMAERLLNQEIR